MFIVIPASAGMTVVNGALTRGADGWTNVTPSADTQIVYVADDGNDAKCAPHLHDGSDPFTIPGSVTPCLTLDHAKTLLRDGFPDWMLLHKGDVWTNETIGKWWNLNGRSEQERMLIGAYGTGARPLLQAAANQDGFNAARGISNVALIGIHFHSHTRDPNSPAFDPDSLKGTRGVLIGARNNTLNHANFLVEDVRVEYFGTSIILEYRNSPPMTNVEVRRSVFAHAYNSGSHSQGFFVYGMNGVLLEENLIINNGWLRDRDNGHPQVPGTGATRFNQGIYMQTINPILNNPRDETEHIIIRNNIIADNSGAGIQARAGGTIEGNLILRSSFPILIGGPSSRYDADDPDGVHGIIRDNVVTDLIDNRTDEPGGNAIRLRNIATAKVDNNLVYNDDGSVPTNTRGISFFSGNLPTVTNNTFHNWLRGAVSNVSGSLPVEDNNRYWDAIGANWPITGSNRNSEDLTFPDPTRSVGSYNAIQGGAATYDAFIQEARLQSRDNWRPEYTATAVNRYLREGFLEVGTAGNNPPLVRQIDHNATDAIPTQSGLQVVEGNTITFTGTATDRNGDALTWEWRYTVDDDAAITYSSGNTGSNPIADVSFNYPVGSAGKRYVWILRVSDGEFQRETYLPLEIVTPSPPSADPPAPDPIENRGQVYLKSESQ